VTQPGYVLLRGRATHTNSAITQGKHLDLKNVLLQQNTYYNFMSWSVESADYEAQNFNLEVGGRPVVILPYQKSNMFGFSSNFSKPWSASYGIFSNIILFF